LLPIYLPIVFAVTFLQFTVKGFFFIAIFSLGSCSKIKKSNKIAVTSANGPFITRWQTDNPGDSDDNQIAIPLDSASTYNFTINWGDGANERVSGSGLSSATHTYATAGAYDVSIAGTFPRIFFNGAGDSEKLIAILQWGDIEWSSMNRAFLSCKNLTSISAVDVPNLRDVTDMSYMFAANDVLNADLNNWNTSNITNMEGVFAGAYAFNGDISDWDTSNVTTMAYMFSAATSFNRPIGNWNTAKVTDMSSMFSSASAFNQDISAWNTSNVTLFNEMFRIASAFNQPIGNWNTTKVTNMRFMFMLATNFNQPLNWDTSNVTTMYLMFQNAPAFNQPFGPKWNTAKVTDFLGTFFGATSFNQNIGNWNTSAATDMSVMFRNATHFNQDLSAWNVSHVTASTDFSFNTPAWALPKPAGL
jgi:surface protein